MACPCRRSEQKAQGNGRRGDERCGKRQAQQSEDRPEYELAQDHHGRRHRHRARLDQRGQQITLEELDQGVEPDHHRGEHEQPRQLGEFGQRSARAKEHDGKQDSGESQQDRRTRIPKPDGESEHANDGRRHLGGGRHVAGADHGSLPCAPLGRVAQSWLSWHSTLARWARVNEKARVSRAPLYGKHHA